MATIKTKISNNDDEWPFKSPSGLNWTNVFFLDEPKEINISHTLMKYVLGHKGDQT